MSRIHVCHAEFGLIGTLPMPVDNLRGHHGETYFYRWSEKKRGKRFPFRVLAARIQVKAGSNRGIWVLWTKAKIDSLQKIGGWRDERDQRFTKSHDQKVVAPRPRNPERVRRKKVPARRGV